jgi:putative spermidine/putrescine transport system ATP-binding protein
MTVAGNDQFIVKIPNAHGHAVLARGDTVKLGWTAQDCRALDAPRAAATPA